MKFQHTLFLTLLVILFFGCKTNIQSVSERTYQFVVIPQNSKVQFLFDDEANYSSLTNIRLPNWEGCNGQFKRGAFTDCTKRSLEHYINEQFQIPQMALDNVVEGKVGYQFILDKEGKITNGRITNNPGAGLGEEMERTLLSAPQFEPAEINSGSFVATEISLEVYCDIVLR